MTRKESLTAFIKKTLLPVAVATTLFFIFKSACTKDGITDYFMLWLLCGLPFGIHRMFLWIIPGGRSFGGSIAVFALNILRRLVCTADGIQTSTLIAGQFISNIMQISATSY